MATTRRIVLELVQDDSGSSTIQVVVLPSVAQNSPVQFGGFWTGVKPAVVEYSANSGDTWTPASNFQANDDGTFSGTGPVAISTGPLSLTFRDRDHTSVQATATTTVVATSEGLNLNPIDPVTVGQSVLLSGTWNGSAPPGLEFSVDTGTWSTVTNYSSTSDGLWVGTGDVPLASGTDTTRVRRQDHPTIISNDVTYIVRYADSLTLNTPARINVGDSIALSGLWTGTNPSSLQYSLDGGVSWPGSLTSFSTTDASNGSGTWSGIGPVYSTAGSSFIRVRNAALISVASTSATVTVVTPTVTLNTPSQVTTGNAFALTGGWTFRQPTAMQYSTNAGSTWTDVTGFSANSTSWSGTGPTPGSAGNTNILVRDKNHTSIVSGTVVGVAVTSATATITLDTPAQVNTGTAFALSGTWTVTKPTAMDYSTDGGSTYPGTVGSFAATGTTSGNWTGTGSTPGSAGSTSFKVRDHNATSVISNAATGVAVVAATSTISLSAPAQIALGSPFAFSGTWGGHQPTAIDWSDNAGSTWTALTSPTINANGTWSSVGPTPNTAKTYTLRVRDHDNTGVVSADVNGSVVSTEVITLDTPNAITVNTPLVLTGTYLNKRPTAMAWSITNFSTPFSNCSSFSTTVIDAVSGTWQGTSLTPTSAGTLSVRAMDGNNSAAKSNTVSAVVLASGPLPSAISLNQPAAVVVNNAIALSGTWTTTQPSALDYTTNGGTNWTAVSGFSALSGGTWSGTGPTPTSAGTVAIQVRDNANPTVTSGTLNVTVNASAPPASVTLDPPPAVTAGGVVSLSGTWVTTKPSAMDYSLDNGATWTAIGSFSPTGSGTSGPWTGNGPTTSVAGTLSIKVRDHNSTAVQAGPSSVTVNAASDPGTGTQAVRTSAFTHSLGVNIHSTSGTYDAPNNGAQLISDMKNIGITRYRDGALGSTAYFNAMDAAGFSFCFYPKNDAAKPATVVPAAQTIAFAKQHNIAAFLGPNEVNYFPAKYTNLSGQTFTDQAYNGSPYGSSQATAWVMLELYNAAKADPATRNIPIYNAGLGLGAPAAWTAFRDSAGSGHDWKDRAEYADGHWYTNAGDPIAATYSNGLNYLDYNRNVITIPLPNPQGLVSTEWGYNTILHTTPAGQAKLTWLGWVTLFQYGLRDMYIYEMYDFDGDATKTNGNWGIHHHDHSPKPAVQVLKNVFTILSDNGAQTFTPGKLNYSFTNMPTGMAGAGPGKSILLQSSNGAKWIIPFVCKKIMNSATSMISNPAVTVTLNLVSAPATVTYYDPMVSSSPQGGSSGAVSSFNFNLSDTPVILKIT